MCPNPLLKVTALAGGMLLMSLGASTQKISAGVVAGGSLTNAYRDVTIFQFLPSPEPGAPPRLEGGRSWSPSKDYIIGGMLEVRFNPRWSLEVNGLFRQSWSASAADPSQTGALGAGTSRWASRWAQT